jgi:hypothetical protein
MQNLLEIQNALRSAPDQQLMALMQGANPAVPQWAVASELNNRREMRMEQTRQEGLGQPTVLAQLTGAASAPTPQTNVAGMPQGVASGMAQSMAPKTNVNQNTGIASVAPVATMASGGILKMQKGGDPAEKTYTFIYPEGMNTPPFELGISDLDEYDAVIKAIRKLGGTIVETDTGRVMQSDTAKEILQESSDVAEADARVPKYVPSASDLYATEAGRFKSENATPENYVVSAGLPPAGGAMYSSPTGARGGNTDSSGLGLPTSEFSEVPLSAIPRLKGLATLGAAGDADMLDETVGVQTAPTTPSSPGIAAGTPFDTTKYTPRLPETSAKAIQTGVDDKGRGIFIPSLEETQLDNLRGRSGVGAFSKVPFNATSDEAAKESVNQATLANNARDERVARVTSDEPGTELAETVETAGRIAPKADEPQQLRFINDILNRDAGEAAADVAKATTNENYPVSPVEVRKRLRAMEEKDADADERFDLAEARLDAERAAGLTAGKNAFVAPSSADPTSNAALTAKLVEQMEEKDAPVSDSTRLDSYLNAAGQQGRAIGAAANYTPKLNLPSYEAQLDGEFDKRVIEMRELADGIASGEYTGNGLKIAQDRIKYLNSVMEATGGAETLFEYLDDGAKKVVQKIIAPAAVNMADFILGGGAQVALPEVLGGGVANTAATQDYLDILQRETDGKPNIPTKPSVLESNSILDAMITNDAQTKAGSAAKVDDSLGALITDGKAQIEAVPGPLLTPELNNKLAAGLETVVQDRTKEISKDGALINKMWGESKLQPGTNVESQIVNAEGLTAAEQLDADRAAGLTAGENAFVATTNQDAGGGGKDKPKGIATINPTANRASDSPSSYEQKLLDILAEREKSADQDKWLGLAEMGMRLMASSNPNMLSAIGEAGLGASQTFLGNKRKAEAQEMDILTKLSALESRKQIADDANRTRLEAARISRSGRSPAGSYASVNAALSGIKAQITAIEGSMPATPPTDSRALDAYNKQLETLSSLREQEKRLMSTNPIVASIFANVDGTNTPAAVDLS